MWTVVVQKIRNCTYKTLWLCRKSSFLTLYLAYAFPTLFIMFLPHALVNQVLKGCMNAHTALPSSEDYRTAVFKHFTQSAYSSCTKHALYSSHLYVPFTSDITLPKAVQMKHLHHRQPEDILIFFFLMCVLNSRHTVTIRHWQACQNTSYEFCRGQDYQYMQSE